ncbi:NADH:flavin oxidoreductase/NADH oxidase [Pseudomonas borbori]|uniref:2,4-dienoyl-CoA reductase n=1 Tax=Pseudomonas borbori TaxID=289003 RepID=A0A1I5XHU1_9PSED|nr:NADH:flavin oxidoreductase/NADH oxidase [Pseudomonas borbori]SFQ31514.1 2,4-dienoyl-CoA reductase [Pseudomonas borbori]
MSQLFTPHALGKLTLKNRLIVAPMCQYSAKSGFVQPWHEQHLGHLACSGAAAVTIEATAVSEEGRVTHGCLGLWSDEQAATLGQLVGRVRDYSDAAIGIQLNHAGRKGSALPPWEGGKPMSGDQAWQTLAPTALPWGEAWPTPAALGIADMQRIAGAFVVAARRAVEAGLDYIEIHSAHGYLLHSFLSPISNRREDVYGGSLENRMRFPLMVVKAVRKAIPESMTLGMRINGSDWLDEGWKIEDAQVYAVKLEQSGVDYISVSSGGACQGVRYDNKPAYQAHMAAAVRKKVTCSVVCAGLIADANLAESMVAEQQSDFIALGRAILDDPRWPVRAARKLDCDLQMPQQYMLASPGYWPLA